MTTRREIEAIAMALPAAAKVVQWGDHDVYKVGGKVFAVCGFENGLAFKVSEIGFVVLTEDGGPGRQAPAFGTEQAPGLSSIGGANCGAIETGADLGSLAGCSVRRNRSIGSCGR